MCVAYSDKNEKDNALWSLLKKKLPYDAVSFGVVGKYSESFN